MIFDHVSIDESSIINQSIDDYKSKMDNITGFFITNLDTTVAISEAKVNVYENLVKQLDVADDPLLKAFPKEFQNISYLSKLSDFKKKLESVVNWAQLRNILSLFFTDLAFDYYLVTTRLAILSSKNFAQLNEFKNSDAYKLNQLLLNSDGKSNNFDNDLGNIFVSFTSSPGINIIKTSPVANPSSGKIYYYSSLNTFLQDFPQYQRMAANWLIILLKKIQFDIRKSTKDNNNKELVDAISKYNLLPDIDVDDDQQQDLYSSLINDINQMRDRYKFKVLPLKDEVVEEFSDNKIGFYTLPTFALIQNYEIDSKNILGIYKVQENATVATKTIDFHVKLASLRVNDAIRASTNKGDYLGVYSNWTLDNYQFTVDGISGTSSITKEGNILDIHLELLPNDQIIFALLAGYGQFIVKLYCHSNLDPDFKFELDVPINFSYRTLNKVSIESNSIKNNNNNDITIKGFETKEGGRIVLDTPIILKPNSKIDQPVSFQSIPPEFIENKMSVDFRDNFKYFLDVTALKNLLQEIEVTNNFPRTSNEKNDFQKVILKISYDDNKSNEIRTEFYLPKEVQRFKISYPFNTPQLFIEGTVFYENETVNISKQLMSTWHIVLDNILKLTNQ